MNNIIEVYETIKEGERSDLFKHFRVVDDSQNIAIIFDFEMLVDMYKERGNYDNGFYKGSGNLEKYDLSIATYAIEDYRTDLGKGEFIKFDDQDVFRANICKNLASNYIEADCAAFINFAEEEISQHIEELHQASFEV
jgi:hypothetical protein